MSIGRINLYCTKACFWLLSGPQLTGQGLPTLWRTIILQGKGPHLMMLWWHTWWPYCARNWTPSSPTQTVFLCETPHFELSPGPQLIFLAITTLHFNFALTTMKKNLKYLNTYPALWTNQLYLNTLFSFKILALLLFLPIQNFRILPLLNILLWYLDIVLYINLKTTYLLF